ncbi:hypothetical protein L1987_00292 [Smallanthus sonchifolius]|uniref:Uncharacterized protein n=1 Tax=Smallanthus sonchifolius TaxID=185202 RepID=A0ACB9K1X0_9ASTR|nr:hypothetical protein L1987_00292 [Smallanthus sonchifolius]
MGLKMAALDLQVLVGAAGSPLLSSPASTHDPAFVHYGVISLVVVLVAAVVVVLPVVTAKTESLLQTVDEHVVNGTRWEALEVSADQITDRIGLDGVEEAFKVTCSNKIRQPY